jgi:hypothetical protein
MHSGSTVAWWFGASSEECLSDPMRQERSARGLEQRYLPDADRHKEELLSAHRSQILRWSDPGRIRRSAFMELPRLDLHLTLVSTHNHPQVALTSCG